jgi:hypothetical protein
MEGGRWQTLSAILSVNEEDRVLLAHSRLQPQSDGSVSITRLTARGVLKINQVTWTQKDFLGKSSKIEKLIKDLNDIRKELSTVSVVFGFEQGQSMAVATNVTRATRNRAEMLASSRKPDFY